MRTCAASLVPSSIDVLVFSGVVMAVDAGEFPRLGLPSRLPTPDVLDVGYVFEVEWIAARAVGAGATPWTAAPVMAGVVDLAYCFPIMGERERESMRLHESGTVPELAVAGVAYMGSERPAPVRASAHINLGHEALNGFTGTIHGSPPISSWSVSPRREFHFAVWGVLILSNIFSNGGISAMIVLITSSARLLLKLNLARPCGASLSVAAQTTAQPPKPPTQPPTPKTR